MKALLSVAVFAVAYLVIATDKVNKTIVAILGAALVLFLKLVTFQQAVRAIDLNVIFLLVGMMTSVYILSKTGFFEWAAVSLAKFAKGDPVIIMVLLLSMTAFISAFLDNVTTVIMMVPVTILIAQLLEISPTPFIIMEAISSNIGGTATLIGDPPNILIGSQAGLSFNDFLVNLTPIVLLVFVAFIVTMVFWFRKSFSVPENIKLRVTGAIPGLAIIDQENMIKSLVILGLTFVGFFLQRVIGMEAGTIALVGGMLMLLVCKCESEETLMEVEWGVIMFFIGMFMMISALEVNGIISSIAHNVINVAGNNLFLVCIVVLWGSAVFSAVLDNIPFVMAMVPLVKYFIHYFSMNVGIVDPAVIQRQVAMPLWWALALGACLGGNGTLIGASANIVSARMSARNGYPITFRNFLRYGSVFLVQAMLLCTAYLWFRYFR